MVEYCLLMLWQVVSIFRQGVEGKFVGFEGLDKENLVEEHDYLLGQSCDWWKSSWPVLCKYDIKMFIVI